MHDETHVLNGMQVPMTVQKHRSFWWDTKLSAERMRAISDWVGSLSKEDRDKLDDLLEDYRNELLDERD